MKNTIRLLVGLEVRPSERISVQIDTRTLLTLSIARSFLK